MNGKSISHQLSSSSWLSGSPKLQGVGDARVKYRVVEIVLDVELLVVVEEEEDELILVIIGLDEGLDVAVVVVDDDDLVDDEEYAEADVAEDVELLAVMLAAVGVIEVAEEVVRVDEVDVEVVEYPTMLDGELLLVVELIALVVEEALVVVDTMAVDESDALDDELELVVTLEKPMILIAPATPLLLVPWNAGGAKFFK